MKKLGEFISFEKGKKMTLSGSGRPYIGIENLRTNKYSTHTQETSGIKCEPSDVLLVWDGAHAGTVGIGLQGFVGSTIVKVLPGDQINSHFLYFLLIFYQTQIRSAAQGAAIPHLNKTFISNLKVFLPFLGIQTKIVERLDTIQEAQKLNDQLIEKTDELFLSLLRHELDSHEKGWKIKKLGEISEINPTKSELKDISDKTEVGFLAMADVSDNAEIINVQIRKLGEVRKSFTYFKNGDVLFAKITPCMENGKGAFVDGMKNDIGFGSTEFHVLRVNEEFFSNRLLYFIVSNKAFRKTAEKFMYGAGGQQRISTDYLRNLKMYLPPLSAQKQIVAKLDAVQQYKSQLLAQKAKLKELFDSVLAKSMTGEMIS